MLHSLTRQQVLVGIVLFALIVGVISYLIIRSALDPDPSSYRPATITNKTTGEEIDVEDSRTRESYGEVPSSPITIGFRKIIDGGGMDTADADKFQLALREYVRDDGGFQPNSIIALKSYSVNLEDEDSSHITYYFTATVDDSTELSGGVRTDRTGPISVRIEQKGKPTARKDL